MTSNSLIILTIWRDFLLVEQDLIRGGDVTHPLISVLLSEWIVFRVGFQSRLRKVVEHLILIPQSFQTHQEDIHNIRILRLVLRNVASFSWAAPGRE